MSSHFKMANDNLQSVLNVNTEVRCKQSSVMYISVNKLLVLTRVEPGLDPG